MKGLRLRRGGSTGVTEAGIKNKKPITKKSRWVQLGVILLQPSGGKQLLCWMEKQNDKELKKIPVDGSTGIRF